MHDLSLGESEAAAAGAVNTSAGGGESLHAALPRIPTREEEAREASRRVGGQLRSMNPSFVHAEIIARQRLLLVGKWCLRKAIGGNCESPESLKAQPVISFYHKTKVETAADVKSNGSKAKALLAILSQSPAARAALESARSLVTCDDYGRQP